MVRARILLEKDLTDEQLIALHFHYKQEDRDNKERLKRQNVELFEEAKDIMRLMKSDIYIQLRKSNRMEAV